MKKAFHVLCLIVSVSLFSSCKVCVDCTNTKYGETIRMCKPNYDDKKAWEQRLDMMEGQGYLCH
jgi:hypothetical protein